AKAFESLGHFMSGSFLETVHVHVADSGTDIERHIDAVTRNFVTHDVEFEWLLRAFSDDRNADVRPFRSLEQIGNFARAHVVSWFAVDRDDHVARTNAGFVSWRSHEGRHHDHLVIPRPDLHADPVVLSALIFAQKRVLLRVKEIRVRIEHSQHAGNRSIVYNLVRFHRLGIILLDETVNLRELSQVIADFAIAG